MNANTLVLSFAFLAGVGTHLESLAQNRPAPCTPIVASGTITKPGGSVASFAAVAGCSGGKFWGSLSFSDGETGYQVAGMEITGYLWDPNVPEVREICGKGFTGKREEVMFRARLVDNGGGGRNDEFGFATDNPRTAGSRFYIMKALPLDSGNVRVQRAARADADRALAKLGEFRMCGDLNTPR